MAATLLPKLKHTAPVYPAGDLLYIEQYGQALEIPDGDGAIRRLLELLDGTRTPVQAHAALATEFPKVTLAEVCAAIDIFDEARLLLNEAIGPEGVLDDYELARWHRNVNFLGSYCRLSDSKYQLQRRLLDSRVTLLGLGGLGSHLLLDMAAIGIGHVRVVEFDRVELSNLNRQILYRESDIGQPKIDLAVARVQEFNSRIDIEKKPGRIESTADALDAVNGADAVICVADRPKMEIIHWVNEACVREGVPLLQGGLDTQRAVYLTVIPGETGCIECWESQVFGDDEVSARLLAQKRGLQIGGDNAAFVPLVTMTTGFLMGELARLLTGIAPPVAAGRLMQLRFADYELTEYETWKKLPDCPVCGTGSS